MKRDAGEVVAGSLQGVRGLRSVHAMLRSLCTVGLLFVFAVAVAGCHGGTKAKPKSTARIYEGDSPNVRMNEKSESAGGRLYPYH